MMSASPGIYYSVLGPVISQFVDVVDSVLRRNESQREMIAIAAKTNDAIPVDRDLLGAWMCISNDAHEHSHSVLRHRRNAAQAGVAILERSA